MEKFDILKSIPANLPMMNVDTDMIIPKQFLKTIKRDGLGKSLFFEMRYNDQGKKIDSFILNKEPYNKSSILLAGKNFGCGSSREHAPACLKIADIQAIVAASYARIFYRNSVDGGFFTPFETPDKLVNDIRTGDKLVINVEAGILANNSTDQTYKLQPLGEVAEIVKAGNIFEYARKAGMI